MFNVDTETECNQNKLLHEEIPIDVTENSQL
nr:MAG: hypothetical protein CM15mV30_1750 [uncultured marine virus]